jgi:hypothetical protein
MLYADFLKNDKRRMLKALHYFPAYERHFQKFVNQTVTFLEIGVCEGGSLQMWRRYFGPLATIIGIDIVEGAMFEEDQIHVRIGHQSDPQFLKSILEEFGRPDIVLDDGSHKMADIKATFEFLYPFVSKNGVYMVEDLHTAYWERYGGGLGKKESFIEYTKRKIDELNAYNIPKSIPTDFTKNTYSIHIYDSLVVFEKTANRKHCQNVFVPPLDKDTQVKLPEMPSASK